MSKRSLFVCALLSTFLVLSACGSNGADGSSSTDEDIATITPSIGAGTTTETCDNESDDDADGYTDCDDSDCDSDTACVDDGSGSTSDVDDLITESNCSDSSDDDADGYTDCDDSDCDADAACAIAATESLCSDGTDDDSDGTVDCDDSDCSTNEYCVDLDADSYSVAESDCDDNDATVYPDAAESADDGIDQDCDGSDLDANVDLTDVDTTDSDLKWVDASADASNTACTFEAPCNTIQKAVDNITSDEQEILVVEGSYTAGFAVTTMATHIYGGIYEDTSVDPSVWKASPTDHPSRVNIARIRKTISLAATEGTTVINGLTIITGYNGEEDITITDSSATLRRLIVRTSTDSTAVDGDGVSMIVANYQSEGDYHLTIDRSTFRVGAITGTGLTEDVDTKILTINNEHADAHPIVSIDQSHFVAGGISVDTDSNFWSVYYDDFSDGTEGANQAARFDITDSVFHAMEADDSGSLRFFGSISGIITGNQFTHDGSDTDMAIASTGSGTVDSALRLSNNLFIMDNTTGIGDESYAVMAIYGTQLALSNNTIVHTATVPNGYGVYMSDTSDAGLSLTNNLFSNLAVTDRLPLYIGSEPLESVSLTNNLFYELSGSDLSFDIDGTTYTTQADVEAAYPSIFTFTDNVFAIDPGFDSEYTPSAAEAIDGGYTARGIDTSDMTDVYGNTRVVDGDGVGRTVIDIGAVEKQ